MYIDNGIACIIFFIITLPMWGMSINIILVILPVLVGHGHDQSL